LQAIQNERLEPLRADYSSRRTRDDRLRRLEDILVRILDRIDGAELREPLIDASTASPSVDPARRVVRLRALRALRNDLLDLLNRRLAATRRLLDDITGDEALDVRADLSRAIERVAGYGDDDHRRTLRTAIDALADDGASAADLALRTATFDDALPGLRDALAQLAEMVQRLRQSSARPWREGLCALLGEVRTFLQTGFAHIAAKDPRSTASSHHFFLREFAQEAHEALILLREIKALEIHLIALQRVSIAGLPLTPENLLRILRVLFDERDGQQRIPGGDGWRTMAAFVERLRGELVPRLQRACALDGIRYEDQRHLAGWAQDLLQDCTECLVQHDMGSGMVSDLDAARSTRHLAAAGDAVVRRTCREMKRSLQAICMTLTAMVPYIGIMRGGIEQRASVFFHRQQQVRENDLPLDDA
ncbi:MAG: hypothetical protein AAF772_18250, partial [Acidobacteriota bacterium]